MKFIPFHLNLSSLSASIQTKLLLRKSAVTSQLPNPTATLQYIPFMNPFSASLIDTFISLKWSSYPLASTPGQLSLHLHGCLLSCPPSKHCGSSGFYPEPVAFLILPSFKSPQYLHGFWNKLVLMILKSLFIASLWNLASNFYIQIPARLQWCASNVLNSTCPTLYLLNSPWNYTPCIVCFFFRHLNLPSCPSYKVGSLWLVLSPLLNFPQIPSIVKALILLYKIFSKLCLLCVWPPFFSRQM